MVNTHLSLKIEIYKKKYFSQLNDVHRYMQIYFHSLIIYSLYYISHRKFDTEIDKSRKIQLLFFIIV